MEPTTPPSSSEDEAATVVKLWRHDCKQCPSRWSRFQLRKDEESAVEEQMAKMPIVHRQTYSDETWTTASFTVNHSLMREVLAKVLDGYPGFDLAFHGWTFQPPYRPIVHRWHKLQDFLRTAPKDDRLFSAARLLAGCVNSIVCFELKAVETIRLEKKIAFQFLWYIFVPGELAMDWWYGRDMVTRILKCELGSERENNKTTSFWTVDTEFVNWNGDEYGYRTMTHKISYYEGYCDITSLSVWPMSFSSEPAESITSRMVARGRKFAGFCGSSHVVRYDGQRLHAASGGQQIDKPTSGRVILDAAAYYLHSTVTKPTLRALRSSSSKAEVESAKSNPEGKEGVTPLADEDCLLTSPFVPGFDLKTKEWSRFSVDHISEIEWDDAVFSNLVAPGDQKELAWSFVASKMSASSEFDDFVAEKGRGVVILAFGGPGVGKTYTAEAVAEKGRLPLYTLSAGALGAKPGEVEAALSLALDLCQRWRAVLLLDEADVFLAARQEDALARNELVSIFLAKLEYYQGVVFLTTNRMADIDHAFQSRVDLFLHYGDLGVDAKRQIWQNFTGRAGYADKFEIDAEGYDRLALLELNGREIKNLVKNALRLSSNDGPSGAVKALYQLAENRAKAMEVLTG
ncbi:hypothetical protein MAPG_10625 [Magnaporthiopsis poae ATCC 64411]|uniref:AAA+ ATPase domain-containing protein n=1 Tax=Magnaporthiopsis poae (strain ATCC 64411 / 73-15) TaxID=644358 RepID=A0A0C4ED32_MAGP6|nr:hypothetical protein MAPG_10625 [Magnaporthiopsis poae ATCC 64411]